MTKELIKGDYVLASKYRDGDPRDHFAVGYFTGMLAHTSPPDRFNVVDDKGERFRGNGFRRCERISHRVGGLIVDNLSRIEQSGRSVWWWRRNVASLEVENAET